MEEEKEKVKLNIGLYSREERYARIQRYLEKRKQRTWVKSVKYTCRKQLADSRPRIKGRFIPKKIKSTCRTSESPSKEDRCAKSRKLSSSSDLTTEGSSTTTSDMDIDDTTQTLLGFCSSASQPSMKPCVNGYMQSGRLRADSLTLLSVVSTLTREIEGISKENIQGQ